ncbi:MAG: septal ring lytic transglycosylase RlpA family protein [Campylobacterota bacterium]|nr:septal ring lytic transglycosylase RlpA family protein [Campylobacterota bacterium]
MLLNMNKNILLLTIVVFMSGCGGYSYTNKSYKSSSYAYKQNLKVDNGNTKIRNSKAMHRATMRPYVVFNKKYYPTLAHIDDKFDGIASWYGPKFHAKKTSNGEIYNMYAMTAAHKTLPMNTIVKVENKENGKSIIVRINDRGPFVAGRIIDLSNVAAHKIDMVKKGTAKVRLTVLGFHGKIAKTAEEKSEVQSVDNYYVQVGVFAKVVGANTTKRKFEMILDENKYRVVLKDGYLNDKKIKRVWISGFRSEGEASDFKEANNLQGAMIIAQ